MRIAKLGVVGAGTMGSGIAALAASAGIPVVLLDIPGTDGDRNGPAKSGLERAKKARPAAFMDPARASLITLGNLDDDLELSDCDLILEAIIEQPAPKQALYARLEPLLKPTAIVASNTSGIPMKVLVEGRSARFKQHFLGMHFFNPPRYLHLLELIPTPDTAPDVLDATRRFSEVVLGKGIVVAKDVPGFVANRLGVYGMVAAMKGLMESDLTIDEVDALTGPLLGRAKSATFRTADITGLDVLLHVSKGLSASTGEDFSMPDWVTKLAESGRLGDKTGGGFYKKVGKDITTLDWKTLEYGPQQKVDDPALGALMKQPLEKRIPMAEKLPGKYGEFVRNYLLRMSHYVLKTTPAIAYDIVSVDRAIEWGYAWEAGPFQQMDSLGHDFLREGFAQLGLDLPPLLEKTKNGAFFAPGGTGGTYLAMDGSYAPVPPVPGQIALDVVRARKGAVVERSKDANLLDLGDGVLLLEARSKMNTMGAGVLGNAAHGARSRRRRQVRRARDRQRRSACLQRRRGSRRRRRADAGRRLEGTRGDGALLPGRRAARAPRAISRSSPRRSGSRSAADASTRCTAIASRRTPSCTWGSSKLASVSSRRAAERRSCSSASRRRSSRTTRPIRSRR